MHFVGWWGTISRFQHYFDILATRLGGFFLLLWQQIYLACRQFVLFLPKYGHRCPLLTGSGGVNCKKIACFCVKICPKLTYVPHPTARKGRICSFWWRFHLSVFSMIAHSRWYVACSWVEACFSFCEHCSLCCRIVPFLSNWMRSQQASFKRQFDFVYAGYQFWVGCWYGKSCCRCYN